MAKLTLFAPKMTANLEDRTISGLLLPFNEVGYTNLGKLTASEKSALDVAEMVIFNIEHESTKPIGKALTLTQSPEGIRASFKVLETTAGNDALVEADAGVRAGLSIEIEPVIVKAGHIESGTITGAGLVTKPAFSSAKLNAAEAPAVPDMGEPDPEAPEIPAVVIDGEALDNVTEVTVTDTEIDITTKDAAPADPNATEKEDPIMAAAAVTNAALAAAHSATPDKNKLFAGLASHASEGQNRMVAALSDVIPGDILGVEQPQYVSQLWSGKAYERRIVPLYNHADLTSFKVQGWRWVTKPEVGDYAGNKGAVPSNEIETESVAIDAYRFAGAHDIDRKFVDFDSPEFWAAYYAAMTESAAKKSDIKVRNIVRDAATRVHLLNAAMTAGVPQALNLIVKGAVKVMNDLDGVIPDHAYVTTDLWEPLLFTKESDVLVYLNAALGLRENTLEQGQFKIIPVPVGSLTVDLATDFVGKVLVACKDAVTVHELGGEAPIRVEAPNIAQGGVDAGVFSYGAVNVHNTKGIVLYDAPTAS